MRDARRERAALQPRPGDEAEPHAAGREVAFDHGDLREVALRVGDRMPGFHCGLSHERLRHDLILDQADRPCAATVARDGEVRRGHRSDADGLAHPLRDLDARDVLDRPAALEHSRRSEAHEVGQEEQVRDVARRDRAVSRKAVPEGGVMRGHEHGVLGRDPGRNRLAHHPVDVARVGDVLRIAIVGAERDAPRAVLLDEREERAQVPRHRGLADEQPHPGAQALAPLLDGERLVVRVDARGRVRLELRSENAGRMAVHVPRAVERELLELARGALR